MTDPLSQVYQKRDNTGAAAILQKSDESAADLFVKINERDRAAQRQDDKLPEYKYDFTGMEGVVGGTWINDRPELSERLSQIKQADAMLRMQRKKLGEHEFAKLMGEIELQKQMWKKDAYKSQAENFWLTKTIDEIRRNPDEFPESVKQYVYDAAMNKTYKDRNFDPTLVQRYSQIDLTNALTPKNSLVSITKEVPTAGGGTMTKSETFLDPVKLQAEAEQIASGKNIKPAEYEKLLREFNNDVPGGTEEDLVTYIKIRMMTGGKYKLRSSETITLPPSGLRSGTWSGTSYITPRFIFSEGVEMAYTPEQDKEWDEQGAIYESKGLKREDIQEPYTRKIISFVRTDAQKNTPLDLEDSNKKSIVARPIGLVLDNGKWQLMVQNTKQVGVGRRSRKEEQRIIIPYEGTNKNQIEGEYEGIEYYVKQYNKRHFGNENYGLPNTKASVKKTTKQSPAKRSKTDDKELNDFIKSIGGIIDEQ
jgi:hypothetical protein